MTSYSYKMDFGKKIFTTMSRWRAAKNGGPQTSHTPMPGTHGNILSIPYIPEEIIEQFWSK